MKPAEVEALVANLLQKIQTPAAVAPIVPVAPAAAPAWYADALASKVKVAKAPGERRPLVAAVTTVYPKCATCDAQLHGPEAGHAYVPKPFSNGATEPFRTLKVSNGLSGRFFSGSNLDARTLIAVAQWFNTDAGKAFLKSGTL